VINHYINEFGDPFSYFVYGEGMNANFFIKRLEKKYQIIRETKSYLVFNFSEAKVLPLIELVAMASMIDLSYIKDRFPVIKNNPQLVTHYFYLLNSCKQYIAVQKKSPIIHYSAATFKTYFSKISWRIRNNIFNKETIGKAGFEGRDQFQPSWFRYKRYLFIPYSYSFFWPLYDGIYLSITRKDAVFLLHPFLSIYASSLILYYYFLYILGFTPGDRRYGT
jgi:hypothetical protein